MAWIQSILQAENGSAVQLLVITICIVVLLILITYIFRKIAGSAAKKRARNRVPRLSVTDWTSVGEKNQLVLVRRDNVEHLLLIGGNSDLVVEENIVRVPTQTKAPTPAKVTKPVAEKTVEENVPAKPAEIADVAVAASAVSAAVASTMVDPKQEVPPATAPETDGSLTIAVEEELAVAATIEETASPDISLDEIAPALEQELNMQEIAPIKAEVSADVPAAEIAKSDTVEFESDLIASISESLDEEVKVNEVQPAVSIDTPVSSEPPSDTNSSAKSEDEMQRLLDELSIETTGAQGTKEPA